MRLLALSVTATPTTVAVAAVAIVCAEHDCSGVIDDAIEPQKTQRAVQVLLLRGDGLYQKRGQ